MYFKACDTLLAQRVEKKLHVKGSSENGVLNRLFVAYPTPRDEKVRAPFIPSIVQHKRLVQKGGGDLAELRDPKISKLERELEVEMGNQYYLDLKKHYLLKNEQEKYDVVPEIWEGHNIADFIDPNIIEVYFYLKLTIFSRFKIGLNVFEFF